MLLRLARVVCRLERAGKLLPGRASPEVGDVANEGASVIALLPCLEEAFESTMELVD